MSQLTFFDDISLNQSDNLIIKDQASYWSLVQSRSQNEIKQVITFTPEECNKIIKLGKRLNVSQSEIGSGFETEKSNLIRSSNNSWIPINEYSKWIYERVNDSIKSANENFYEFELFSFEQLQFTEYHSNKLGHYSKHIDTHHNSIFPNLYRKLSFSIQLSDASVYEGGELLIYFSENPICASKQIGAATFFPSYAMHEVTPTTKGVRYSLVGWATGPRLK